MQTAAPHTFRWSEVYSVHIAILDEQHRRLVATINELNQALRCGMGASVMDSVLGKLMEYANEHFKSEETLMEQHNFPGLPTHRRQHEEFRRRMALFMEAHGAGKPCVPVSVMLYMEKWLKEHMVKNRSTLHCIPERARSVLSSTASTSSFSDPPPPERYLPCASPSQASNAD